MHFFVIFRDFPSILIGYEGFPWKLVLVSWLFHLCMKLNPTTNLGHLFND